MNNLDNFNKITSILKTPLSEQLDQKLMRDFTPRLWGETFVSKFSFEGRIIDIIRWSFSLDDSKKKWKHIFRNLTTPDDAKDLNSLFTLNDLNKIFALKHSYAKKDKNLKQSFKKFSDSSSPPTIKSKNLPSLHWTKDPVQLKRLSLLGLNPSSSTCSDIQIVEALFSLGTAHNGYDPIFHEKFSIHINQALSTLFSEDKNNLNIGLEAHVLLEKANLYEKKLQTVITNGQTKVFSEANLELKSLSFEIAESITNLNPKEKRLIFGGLSARAPKLNFSKFSENSIYKNLEDFLNQKLEFCQIDSILDNILNQIQLSFKNQNPLITPEVATKVRQILNEGFLTFLLPDLKKPLIRSEQNFSEKILLTIPELLRQGTDKVLSFAEKKILEETTERFSKSVSKELCLEICNNALDGDLKQLLKDKIKPLINEHVGGLRQNLISSLNSLTGALPTAATELISALGYGEFGCPDSPLWLEISRQQNGKYSLHIYATGHTAAFQGAVPLVYQDLTIDQLDTDFFMRFFSYRAWPNWDENIQYTLKNIHQELFGSLKSAPMYLPGQFQDLSNELQNIPSSWGLYKALISSHFHFDSIEKRDLFFFNWKKTALIDTWKHFQSGPNKGNLSHFNSLKLAAEQLAEEAVKLFDRKVIDLNEYKAIYATTWEIIETFKQEHLVKPKRKKTSIIPPEILEKLQAFFGQIPEKNSFVARKLIVDILGNKVEPILDELFEDFYANSSPQTFNPSISKKEDETDPELPLEKFKRIGRKFTNLVLDATIGINLNDVSAPTSYTYLKTAFSVARIAYSIFFTPQALALNLKWAVTSIAAKALLGLVEACFPAQVSHVRGKLGQWQKQFEEWRLCIIAYATARLLLNEKQREDFVNLISSWESLITNQGKLTFDLPPLAMPEEKIHLFKKIIPKTSIGKEKINVLSNKILKLFPVEKSPSITSENCLHFLNRSLLMAEELSPDLDVSDKSSKKFKISLTPTAIYCNDQIKALPMPLPDFEEDCWSQVKDPSLLLEKVCALTLKLYTNAQCIKINSELYNQTIISLYKTYAIIDKLARRCPESELESYKPNPWALALLKKNAFFRIVDPQIQEQFAQVCTYFEIDFRKDYSDAEIADLSYDSLFYENDSNDFSVSETRTKVVNTLKSFAEKVGLNSRNAQALSPAERRYYTALLKKPEIQKKLKMLGIEEDAPFANKLGMLYSDGNSAQNKKNVSNKILPRAYYLLRLTNYLANDFVESFEINYRKNNVKPWPNLNLKDVDNFYPASYIEEDSSIRKNLNYWTLGKFFEKESTLLPFRYLPSYRAHCFKNKIGNATNRNKLASVDSFDLFAKNLLCHRKKNFIHSTYGSGNTFCPILSNYLHQSFRKQNEVINSPSSFKTRRETNSWLFLNSLLPDGENMLEELSANERLAIEMIWSDESDEAVRTLAFFSQRMEDLYRTEFFMLFEILLLRSDVLDRQLKTDPAFAKCLGDFFKVALAHYAEIHPKCFLDLIEIGIFALAKASVYDPNSRTYFPDFTRALLSVSLSNNNSIYASKLRKLMHTYYSFIDPSVVTLEFKKRACHDLCQMSAKTRSFDKGVSYSAAKRNYKWITTLAKTLNEHSDIRNEVLNAMAVELCLIPNGSVSWEGEYPHFSSGLLSLGIDLENGLTYTQERQEITDQIQVELKKIYGTRPFKIYFMDGHYHVRSNKPLVGSHNNWQTNDLLTISFEQSDTKDCFHLYFRKKHQDVTYRWVENATQADQIDAESCWIEEKPAGKTRRLVKLHEGLFKSTQTVEKTAKDSYIFLTTEALLDKSKGVKVDLTQNTYGLGSLAWFQPLSAILAFRSVQPPYPLTRIEFPHLNLNFSMEKTQAGKDAMMAETIPGFFLSEDQRPSNKLPLLNNFSSYLLLENSQKQNKVILATDNLKTVLASWLLKKSGRLTTSRLMDKSLTNLLNLVLPSNPISSYIVYDLDERGRLTSGEPNALLHLLLYSVAQEQWDDVLHYLTLFEGAGKRGGYSSEVPELIGSVEIAAMMTRDPILLRISLRLSAIKEENELIQNLSPSNQGSLLISWLAMQANMQSYLSNPNSLSQLPIDEYQELFILHAIAKKGKQFASTFQKNNSSEILALVQKIGIENLAESFLMTPDISSRYTYLKNKYSLDSAQERNLSSILREVVKDKILNTSISRTSLDKTSRTEIVVGLNESSLKKIIRLLSPITNNSLKTALQKYSTVLDCLTFFPKNNVREAFEFISKYRLATNKPSSDDILENNLFIPQQIEFKNNLKYFSKTKKLSTSSSIESEFMHLISNHQSNDFFPEPEDIKILFNAYCYLEKDELQSIRESEDPGESIDKYTQKNNQITNKFENLLQTARYKALAYELSTAWKFIPIHFSELSYDQLSSNFLSYYQMAMETPPLQCKEGSTEYKQFIAKAKAFKKSLLLVSGKDDGERLLLEVLQQASVGNLISMFPSPQKYEKTLQKLITDLENNSENKREIEKNKKTKANDPFISSLQNAWLAQTALPTFKSHIFSFAKNQAKSALISTGISYATSLVGVTISAPLLLASQIGPWVYRGYQAYDAVAKKHKQLENNRALARADRQAIVEKNTQIQPKLSFESINQLNSDDAKFSLPCQELLKKHFKAPLPDLKPSEPILPFDSPSNNPIVKKAFERLNENMVDFYARPPTENLAEELNGLENFYSLKSELEHLSTGLKRILEKTKRNLLSFDKKNTTAETRSDVHVITSMIKERSNRNDKTNFPLDIDTVFNKLILAFAKDDDVELMRLALVNESQLPQLKLKLYRYLLRATRLQQIERGLKVLSKIDPSKPESLEIKILIKQLAFELGRKRAYTFSESLPTKLTRGYLVFEYGSGMMLWDRQVNQLQKMLLGEHSRSILELIMGSGKTVFGTPMINFFGSNGKEVIANFFPDALAHENIKDLSSRSQTFFGQTANAFKISRDQKLTEENLWGLELLLMRALDKKESLNSCKKDFQALQLIFIEEANKALQNLDVNAEKLLWGYMKLLGFIRKNVRANIDEAHRLLRYNDELNHPLGAKKKVKTSYVNVISECMRLLVAVPEIKEKIALESNDQTLCSTEDYHNTIKPLLARKLVHYRPFAILPEQRELFIEYLCGNLTEVPEFITTHPRYSELGLAVGTLNKFIPDAMQKKINVHFGTQGNKHGYAQPYSSKDTPIVGSTFKNPYEAVLKTLMASLHAPLTSDEVKKLTNQMCLIANAKSQKTKKPFSLTSPALLFESWTGGAFKLEEMNRLPANHSKWTEVTSLLDGQYAPRMSYARLFAIPEIEYFAQNLSCNSQNFASTFASFYAETGTPSPEEICPTGTKIVWDPGTAGEFVDQICRTCSDDSITEIQHLSPLETLQELLRTEFHLGSNNRALIDSGPLFYGLSNETVVEVILAHISHERPDLKAVVFFNSKNELVLQEVGKEAVPFANSAISPEERITYFDQSHEFGADIPQGIKVGGKVSINEKTNFDTLAQAAWRMRGWKTAQQNVSLFVDSSAKKIVTSKDKLTIRDVITFTKKNEALSHVEAVFASAQQQIDNVIRSAVLDAMIASSDVASMLSYFKEFKDLFITSCDEDPSGYGDPEIECDPKIALEEMAKQKFKVIQKSFKFSKQETESIRESLLEVGKESTFPETIKLYKRQGKFIAKHNDLGIAQCVSLQQSQLQSQSQEATRNQDVERNQNVDLELNQDLQIDDCRQEDYSGINPLRLEPAHWDKRINFFASLDWWKVSDVGNGFSERSEVEFFNVRDSLAFSSDMTLGVVKEAFQGTMYWSNNLQGILTNGELAEPCSKKQMLELLVIQGPKGFNGEKAPILTCAIDQSEAKFWRKRLENDRNSSQEIGPVKIALFDIALNTFVSSGRNKFDEVALIEDDAFNLDIARWKFLAGHVNLQPGAFNSVKGKEPLMNRFKNWLDTHNVAKMKEAYKSIYKAYGFANIDNSDIQSMFSVCDSDAIPEIL